MITVLSAADSLVVEVLALIFMTLGIFACVKYLFGTEAARGLAFAVVALAVLGGGVSLVAPAIAAARERADREAAATAVRASQSTRNAARATQAAMPTATMTPTLHPIGRVTIGGTARTATLFDTAEAAIADDLGAAAGVVKTGKTCDLLDEMTWQGHHLYLVRCSGDDATGALITGWIATD
jgi:hypothetical protein